MDWVLFPAVIAAIYSWLNYQKIVNVEKRLNILIDIAARQDILELTYKDSLDTNHEVQELTERLRYKYPLHTDKCK